MKKLTRKGFLGLLAGVVAAAFVPKGTEEGTDNFATGEEGEEVEDFDGWEGITPARWRYADSDTSSSATVTVWYKPDGAPVLDYQTYTS